MAVATSAFLGLEDSLTSHLFTSWKTEFRTLFTDLALAIQEDDYVEAQELIDEINFEETVKKNHSVCELIGAQAILFGAQRVAPLKDTVFYNNPVPPEVGMAGNVLDVALVNGGTAAIKRGLSKLLIAIQEDTKEAQIQKAEKQFVNDFVSFVDSSGKAQLQIGASLHNSRLSQFGFLTEATFRQVSTFRVNEQLDNRICPVCKLMHGQVFTTERALDKINQWLGVSDPEELKVLAPWPKQDKASVEALGKMTKGELQDAGLDTPPYHALCRGLLDISEEVFESTATAAPQPDTVPAEEAFPAAVVSPEINSALLNPFGPPKSPGVSPTFLETLTIGELLNEISVAPDTIPDNRNGFQRIIDSLFGN